jgi:hypothetical protein
MASGTSGKSVLQSILQNGTYTLSVFFKYDSCQFVQFFLNDDGDPYANFDIQNGVVGSFANCTSSISNFGNGWYRCSMTYTTTIGTAVVIRTIDTSSASRGASSSNTGSYFVWGAQLEASSYPTSYISTTSASATRVADTYQKAGIGNTSTAGTLFYEFGATQVDSANGQYLIQLFAGSSVGSASFASANSIGIYGNGGAIVGYNNGYGQLLFSITPTVGVTVKVALRYDGTNVVAFVNGVKQTVYSDTATGVKNALRVNNGENGSQATKELVFFPIALTDSECIQLTS